MNRKHSKYFRAKAAYCNAVYIVLPDKLPVKSRLTGDHSNASETIDRPQPAAPDNLERPKNEDSPIFRRPPFTSTGEIAIVTG
jgi:hypothetical protein